MSCRLGLTAIIALLCCFGVDDANAQRARSRSNARPRQLQQQQQRIASTRRSSQAGHDEAERARIAHERAIVKQYAAKRTESRRAMARFFEKITVQRNYTGEYVLHRDGNVTAFLDISDPRHPKYDPAREEDDESGVPPGKRVHVLVVPNTPREHIGQRLGAGIGRGDLEATLEVVKSAERLAKTLNLKNPRVFLNPESRISVGYLHVHIVGEKTGSTHYPAPLSSP